VPDNSLGYSLGYPRGPKSRRFVYAQTPS
jgi:hypothetical protein